MHAIIRRLSAPLPAVVLASLLSACTAQQWYEGARACEANSCMRQPGDEARRCEERAKERPDYEHYEKRRSGY